MRDSAVRAEIVAALDDWASITEDPARRAWLLAVARRADPDPARDRLRQPELWRDGPALTRLVQELRVGRVVPAVSDRPGPGPARTGGDAVPLLTAAQARYPQDFWLNFELGWPSCRPGGRTRPSASTVRRCAPARGQPRLNALGANLYAWGGWTRRSATCEQALRVDPDFALAHMNLAVALRDQGRPDEAIGHFEEAIGSMSRWPMPSHDLYLCRYDAALRRRAGLSGTQPGESRASRLRRRALEWLRANLELRAEQFEAGKAVDHPILTMVTRFLADGPLPWPASVTRRRWRSCPTPSASSGSASGRTWRRMLAADPLEQGRALAARRDWARAADSYARALTRGPTDDGHFWFEYAALLLLSGDRPGYARACARMIEASRQGGGPAGLPRGPRLHAGPRRRRRGVAARPPGREGTQGLRPRILVADRARGPGVPGRPVPAGRCPSSSRACGPTPGRARAVLNWLWLALANQRLGKAEEARRWLGKAQAWLDQYGDGMPARAEEELGLHLHNWLEATSCAARRKRRFRPRVPSDGGRGTRIAAEMKSSYVRRQAGDFRRTKVPCRPVSSPTRPPSEGSFA